jgi:hypothetical protein
MLNIITLIAALAQMLSALVNLAAMLQYYLELRRWRRRLLKSHRRRKQH